jgi:uncharacterized protein YkwD
MFAFRAPATLCSVLFAAFACSACAPGVAAIDDESDTPAEVTGAYRTAVLDLPCPGAEDEDTASARHAIARVRALAGLAPIRCDAAASAAARGHCAYVVANGTLTHVQSRDASGFTGEQFDDRLAAASFADDPAGEVIASITGADAIVGPRGFLNSVYHRALFLRGETISFGYGSVGGCATIDFGRSRNTADVPHVTVIWPPDGAKNVATTFFSSRELPNPLPGSTVVGSPVSLIRTRAIARVDASLHGPLGAVAAAVVTSSSDPSSLVRSSEAHLVPLEPLAPNTAYSARFTLDEGAVDSELIESRFTTGP